MVKDMGSKILIETKYQELLRMVNVELPNYNREKYLSTLTTAKAAFDVTQHYYEINKKYFDEDTINRFGFFHDVIKSCLYIFDGLDRVKEVLENDKEKDYNGASLILDGIVDFIRKFENEPRMMDLVGPFLTHAFIMEEYYHAILSERIKKNNR